MVQAPGSRAVRPLLQPDDLLADRYRLRQPVAAATPGESGPAVLWLADDEVLARQVAVKVITAAGRRGAGAKRFLDAAAAAGTVASPVLARVYDAAIEERPAQRSGRPAGEIDVAYVVSEWVDGPTLEQVLAEDGPWQPQDAVVLATEIAAALELVHARGLTHGRLHPGNVLLPHVGGVKVTDLLVSSALPDQQMPALRAEDPDGVAADVRDLAALLYACLTARWPVSATPQPSGGVPAAQTTRDGDHRGQLISPRQVRAGVPRALDGVVTRALDPTRSGTRPSLRTAAGLGAALEAAVRDDAPPRPAPPRGPRTPRWVRRLTPLLLSLGFVVAVGFGAYAVGRQVGAVPAPDGAEVQAVSSPPAGTSPVGTPIDLTTLSVRDFDPPPSGDGRERPGAVANAHDGDVTTVWQTERYQSDSFGGLKAGVGLVVDLGAPTPLGKIDVVMDGPGAVLELRGAEQPSDTLVGYPVLARARSDGNLVTLEPRAGAQARYVLVWITGLPRQGPGRFQAGIAELRFTRG